MDEKTYREANPITIIGWMLLNALYRKMHIKKVMHMNHFLLSRILVLLIIRVATKPERPATSQKRDISLGVPFFSKCKTNKGLKGIDNIPVSKAAKTKAGDENNEAIFFRLSL